MRFTNTLTDDAVAAEIGRRVAAARLERRTTQAELAHAAGVSKRTVERLEGGAPTQLGNLLRTLRALEMLAGLERLLPETPVNPIAQLDRQRARVRVRHPNAVAPKVARRSPGWTWGDEK